jgi:ABC-type multidrug transport system fused ATPase/permease subunit
LVQAFRLLRALLAQHKRPFAIAVAGAAVYAACTVLWSVLIRWVTDKIIIPRFEQGSVRTSTVLGVLAVLVAVALVRASGVVVRRVWAGMTAWGVAERITNEVVDRVTVQPATWHRRQSTGDLITRAGVDAEAATSVLHPLPFASSVVVMIVLSTVWLLVSDLLLGAFAVALFPVLVLLNVVYQRRVDVHYDTAQDELGLLSSAVHESFDAVTVVKSFGAERRETERLAVIASRLREARIHTVRIRSGFEALLDAVPTVANILILFGGAYRVRSGAMTVGELTSFIFLFTLLVMPLRLIGYALSELPRSLAGWNRISGLLAEPIEPDPALRLARGPDNSVSLHAVTYSHDGQRAVLDDIDAEIPAGRTVAVVGATGAGKTTLLQLMAGLIAPQQGTVTVPAAGCTLVFQEPFLLAGTVRENVAMGADVRDADLLAALRIAEADFVHSLPNGVDTVIGERGVGLSGGQRQRIALARALVRHPAALLLDDTTSALDPTTEANVLANLGRDLGNTTVVVVASRPSTIALADDVLYLAGARIVAHGRHSDLLDSVPEYRELIAAFEHDRAALDAALEAESDANYVSPEAMVGQ